jgi:hypothetical protein
MPWSNTSYFKKYLYVFKSENTYKIGITDNPNNRFRDIKRYYPNLERIFVFRLRNPRWCESFLLDRFKSKSAGGEWVYLDENDLRNIEKFCLERLWFDDDEIDISTAKKVQWKSHDTTMWGYQVRTKKGMIELMNYAPAGVCWNLQFEGKDVTCS